MNGSLHFSLMLWSVSPCFTSYTSPHGQSRVLESSSWSRMGNTPPSSSCPASTTTFSSQLPSMNTTSTHTATTHFDPPTSCLIFAAVLVYLPSFSAAASSQERKKERSKQSRLKFRSQEKEAKELHNYQPKNLHPTKIKKGDYNVGFYRVKRKKACKSQLPLNRKKLREEATSLVAERNGFKTFSYNKPQQNHQKKQRREIEIREATEGVKKGRSNNIASSCSSTHKQTLPQKSWFAQRKRREANDAQKKRSQVRTTQWGLSTYSKRERNCFQVRDRKACKPPPKKKPQED